MKSAVFTDPQFLDASGTSGLNAAFNTTSGSVASAALANWAVPGLINPEAMTLSFSSLTATVGLPSPWSVMTSGGVLVRAHGVLTGQDSTNYSVSFSSLLPSSGSVTAYLTASIIQIQQDPFPLVGPPPGHPSYNVNFVPTVGYATNVYSVALSASTMAPDNISVFELARTVLSAGQSSITVSSLANRKRAAQYAASPATIQSAGGLLTLAQAQQTVMPSTAGLTHTLPLAATAGGLFYNLVNPTTGNWTIAATSPDSISGMAPSTQAAIVITASGAVTLWANASAGIWEVTQINPAFLLARSNTFLTTQTINDPSTGALIIQGNASSGSNIKLIDNGSATPNKYLRAVNGGFQIVSSDYSTALLTLGDRGILTLINTVFATGLSINGDAAISGTETAGVLNSNSGNLGGVTFPGGGTANATYLNAISGILGGAGFPGAGTINAGAINGSNITAAGNLAGTQVFSTAGNVTAQNGRLRASFGAFASGDINAGVILSDFLSSITTNGYIRFPNNVLIQWGVTPTPVPIDNATHNYNFPTSFSSFCGAIVAFPGSFAPSPGAQMGSQAISASQFSVTVASSTPGGSLGTWFIAIGS